MSFLVRAFHNAGPGAIPTLILGLLLVGAAIRYAIKPEKRLIPLLVSLGIVVMFAGSLAFVSGVMVSIQYHEPVMGEMVLMGVGEALGNVAIALGLVMAAGLAVTIGAVRTAQATE